MLSFCETSDEVGIRHGRNNCLVFIGEVRELIKNYHLPRAARVCSISNDTSRAIMITG
jgi:hypothetical protein